MEESKDGRDWAIVCVCPMLPTLSIDSRNLSCTTVILFFLLSLFYAVIFCRLTNKQTAQRIALDFRYGFGRSMVVLLVGGYYKSRLNWRNEPCQLL